MNIINIADQSDQQRSGEISPREGIEYEVRDRQVRKDANYRDDQSAAVRHRIAVQAPLIGQSDTILFEAAVSNERDSRVREAQNNGE